MVRFLAASVALSATVWLTPSYADGAETESDVPPTQQERGRSFGAVQPTAPRQAVQASEPNLTLRARTRGPAPNEAVCTAPCELSLPAGTYRFTIARAPGQPVPVAARLYVGGPGTLKVEYHSNAGRRNAGWVIALGGLAFGAFLIVTSGEDRASCTDDLMCTTSPRLDATKFVGGMAIAGAGAVIGFPLTSTKDDARVQFIPAVNAALARPPTFTGTDALTRAMPYGAPGFSVQATF